MSTSSDSPDDLPEIFRAAATGALSDLNRLLSSGVSPNVRTGEDETPLTFAIVWNQLQVVKVLLAAGADVEQRDSEWSPLMYAAFEGHLEMVESLLAAGADPSRADAHGRTSAALAEENGHCLVAERLREATK